MPAVFRAHSFVGHDDLGVPPQVVRGELRGRRCLVNVHRTQLVMTVQLVLNVAVYGMAVRIAHLVREARNLGHLGRPVNARVAEVDPVLQLRPAASAEVVCRRCWHVHERQDGDQKR